MWIPFNRHTILNVKSLTVAHLSNTSFEKTSAVCIYQEYSRLNKKVKDDGIAGDSYITRSSIDRSILLMQSVIQALTSIAD